MCHRWFDTTGRQPPASERNGSASRSPSTRTRPTASFEHLVATSREVAPTRRPLEDSKSARAFLENENARIPDTSAVGARGKTDFRAKTAATERTLRRGGTARLNSRKTPRAKALTRRRESAAAAPSEPRAHRPRQPLVRERGDDPEEAPGGARPRTRRAARRGDHEGEQNHRAGEARRGDEAATTRRFQRRRSRRRRPLPFRAPAFRGRARARAQRRAAPRSGGTPPPAGETYQAGHRRGGRRAV